MKRNFEKLGKIIFKYFLFWPENYNSLQIWSQRMQWRKWNVESFAYGSIPTDFSRVLCLLNNCKYDISVRE